MQALFLGLSKYIFSFLMALYTLAAYRGAMIKNEEARYKIYGWQYFFIFLNQLLGYIVLFINFTDIRYIYLLVATSLYFFAVIFLYRIFYPKASMLLVNNMCMLLSVEFIMISRLNAGKCLKQYVIAVIGTALTIIIPAMLKRFRGFKNLGWLYMLLGIVLLSLVLFGNKVFGANLVLTIGPVSVQPSEFVKILYVMFIASMFNKSTSFRQVCLVSVLAAAHVIILVLSTDLGTALIFFIVYILMLYTATGRLSYIIAGALSGSAASIVAYKLFNHVRARVMVWLNPFDYIDDKGYQICQSLFAIGMGSWFGYGLGMGLPGRIPVVEKDFMFSAITEEFGLIFSISLLLICLNNLILMMNIASRCVTLFYRLVAVGLGVTYGFQVFLTVGGAIRMIPMTGVTFPFLSYGGSSLLSSLVMFALINGMYIMRSEEVYERTEKKKKKQKKENRK
ncbi:MAG: FtsW/RodA/SpoVE family cell cycle protein [Lachnospira sp.]